MKLGFMDNTSGTKKAVSYTGRIVTREVLTWMVGSNTKAKSFNDNIVLYEVIVVETALYKLAVFV